MQGMQRAKETDAVRDSLALKTEVWDEHGVHKIRRRVLHEGCSSTVVEGVRARSTEFVFLYDLVARVASRAVRTSTCALRSQPAALSSSLLLLHRDSGAVQSVPVDLDMISFISTQFLNEK